MNAFPIIAPEASGTEPERATSRGEVLETSARMEARCHHGLSPLACSKLLIQREASDETLGNSNCVAKHLFRYLFEQSDAIGYLKSRPLSHSIDARLGLTAE